jgi:hypothetical protein
VIPFATLGEFRQLKTRLHAQTDSDQRYYRILLDRGYRKANQIPNATEAEQILERLRDVVYKFEEASAIREFGGG